MEFLVVIAVFWGIYKLGSKVFPSSGDPVKRNSTPKKSTYSTTRTSSQPKKRPIDELPTTRQAPSKSKYSSNKSVNAKVRKPTYSGPLFAQAGEIGKLFGFADKAGNHNLDGPFAIIDLETSGLNPPLSKIIEIAILLVDRDGNELDRFETLINPGDGKVGRADIHGIDLRMLKGAPTFDEVSGRVLEIVRDSVVVAHNARFEENFLAYEFSEAGHDLNPIPTLDTLWLSRNTIELPNYKLQTVVSGFNGQLVNSHTALGDVIAVSRILPIMLNRIGQLYYPVSHPHLPSISLPFKAKTR